MVLKQLISSIYLLLWILTLYKNFIYCQQKNCSYKEYEYLNLAFILLQLEECTLESEKPKAVNKHYILKMCSHGILFLGILDHRCVLHMNFAAILHILYIYNFQPIWPKIMCFAKKIVKIKIHFHPFPGIILMWSTRKSCFLAKLWCVLPKQFWKKNIETKLITSKFWVYLQISLDFCILI